MALSDDPKVIEAIFKQLEPFGVNEFVIDGELKIRSKKVTKPLPEPLDTLRIICAKFGIKKIGF